MLFKCTAIFTLPCNRMSRLIVIIRENLLYRYATIFEFLTYLENNLSPLCCLLWRQTKLISLLRNSSPILKTQITSLSSFLVLLANKEFDFINDVIMSIQTFSYQIISLRNSSWWNKPPTLPPPPPGESLNHRILKRNRLTWLSWCFMWFKRASIIIKI